jgi:tetratricopeptide (TPR) repeat protein
MNQKNWSATVVTAIVMVGLALVLNQLGVPRRSPTWYAVMLAPGLVVFLHYVYFVMLPSRLLPSLVSDDAERLRWLERVAATPSLIGERMKFVVHLIIFGELQVRGEHEKALAWGDVGLRFKPAPGSESDLRRRMANSMEILGWHNEAAAARHAADAVLEGAEVDFSERLARGKLLAEKGKHGEAVEAFEQGLALVPDGANGALRAEFLLQIALASFNAGRPELTVQSAREAILAGVDGPLLLSAHRVAGMALGNLGRLDESEIHRRATLELVERSGKPAELAAALSQLAGLQRMRGQLAEAEELIARAEAIDAGTQIQTNWAELLRLQGRYEEALERLKKCAPDKPMIIPSSERRLRAVIQMEMSTSEAELGRWDEAEAHLLEAQPVLEPDPKHGLGWLASVARILAGKGERDDAFDAIARVEAMIPSFQDDPAARRRAFIKIGHAALLLEDHVRAEAYWNEVMALEPNPVEIPLTYYYQAKAQLGLGRPAAARELFQKAVAVGIDSYHARLAREALSSVTASA